MNSYKPLTLVLIAAIFFGYLIYQDKYENEPYEENNHVDQLVDMGNLMHQQDAELQMQNRIIVCTTDINANFSQHLISRLILLDSIAPDLPIDIYLRTEGGWEADAFAVIDIIRSISSPVHVHALGEVHSAGLMMLAAATGKRIVYPNTILSFHALEADEDEIFVERYTALFEKYSTLPSDWLSERDGSLYYLTAEESIEYKIADFIKQ